MNDFPGKTLKNMALDGLTFGEHFVKSGSHVAELYTFEVVNNFEIQQNAHEKSGLGLHSAG